MNYNYYSNFKSIDSNNDGIYDQPYSTIFFIDNHPLKFPFQNYYFYHGLLVIRSNYDVNTFSNSTITHFYDLSWLGITIFYSVLCKGPEVVYGLISKRRVK